MKPTRLARLLHLITLTRRCLYHTLKSARDYLAQGLRARGLRNLRHYREIKADFKRLNDEAAMRLAALITDPLTH